MFGDLKLNLSQNKLFNISKDLWFWEDSYWL